MLQLLYCISVSLDWSWTTGENVLRRYLINQSCKNVRIDTRIDFSLDKPLANRHLRHRKINLMAKAWEKGKQQLANMRVRATARTTEESN